MSDIQEELVRDHLMAADMYAAYWDEPGLRPPGMPDDEVAYGLLLHVGLHMRYSGDLKGVELLRNLPFELRERLVGGACKVLIDARLSDHAETLAREAMTDDSAGEEFEQYVYDRDNVDVLLRVASAVGDEVLNQSSNVNQLFLQALRSESALDRVLEENAALTALHSQTVLFLREHTILDRDDPHAWWSARLEQMRDRFYQPSYMERTLERLASHVPEIDAIKAQPETPLRKVADLKEWIREFLQVASERLREARGLSVQVAYGSAAGDSSITRFILEGHGEVRAFAELRGADFVLSIYRDDGKPLEWMDGATLRFLIDDKVIESWPFEKDEVTFTPSTSDPRKIKWVLFAGDGTRVGELTPQLEGLS